MAATRRSLLPLALAMAACSSMSVALALAGSAWGGHAWRRRRKPLGARSAAINRLTIAVLLAGVSYSPNRSEAATVLTANMTVDNAFDLYVSTVDSETGTVVGSGTSWSTTYTYSVGLTPGVTNYIHVRAIDWGSAAAFIGSFDLDNAGFQFSNGSQHLTTTPSSWQLSYTGFGSDYENSIATYGANGVAPWGGRTDIDASAEWLAYDTNSTAYFSASLNPVPEPSTYAMALAGLACGGFSMWRRRKRA